MADIQKNGSITKISAISAEDVFKSTRGDAIHTGIKVGLETIPLLGSLAAELYEQTFAAPATRRAQTFFQDLQEDVKKLQEKFENFNPKEAFENESVKSTVIQATEAAIRTHSKEKHKALRNAILNSALPNSPDENRKAMFIQLCSELTEGHVHILKFFENGRVAELNLEDPSWRSFGSQITELVESIEVACPEFKDQFDFCVQLIDDIHRRGLIGNTLPSQDLAGLYDGPTLTIFAQEFLAFLKSPLDD